MRAIHTSYDARGMVETVTQWSSPTVGSGSVRDQVKYAYDGWGLLDWIRQDPDSAVSGSGYYEVDLSHSKSAPAAGRSTLRRDSQVLKHGATALQTIGYQYLSSGTTP